jgi:hypothetical protein
LTASRLNAKYYTSPVDLEPGSLAWLLRKTDGLEMITGKIVIRYPGDLNSQSQLQLKSVSQ